MNATIQSFGYPESLIKEYKHWVVLLRPEQVTVGSLVLAAKSEAIHLGQLNAEEWAEFALVSQEMEILLVKTYGAEKFNYLALMMVDPNVHFHFVPRYSKPVSLGDREYSDPDWPVRTEMQALVLSEAELSLIKTELKEGLEDEL